jgi:hypothetical protein
VCRRHNGSFALPCVQVHPQRLQSSQIPVRGRSWPASDVGVRLYWKTPPSQRRICISIDLRYSSAAKKIESAMSSALMRISFFLHSFYTGNHSGRGWSEEMAEAVRRKLEKRAAHTFLRILDLTSPSLQTLSVSLREMAFPTSFSNLPLPTLRKLTIAYAGGCSTSSDPVPECVLTSLEPLPSLQRQNLQTPRSQLRTPPAHRLHRQFRPGTHARPATRRLWLRQLGGGVISNRTILGWRRATAASAHDQEHPPLAPSALGIHVRRRVIGVYWEVGSVSGVGEEG